MQVDGAQQNTPCFSRGLRHTAKNGKKSPKWQVDFICLCILYSPPHIHSVFMFSLQIPSRTIVQIRTHAQKYFQKLEKQKQKDFANREHWNPMRTQIIQASTRGPNTLTPPPPPLARRCSSSMAFHNGYSSRGMHEMGVKPQDAIIERDPEMMATLVASMRWQIPQFAV